MKVFKELIKYKYYFVLFISGLIITCGILPLLLGIFLTLTSLSNIDNLKFSLEFILFVLTLSVILLEMY